MRPLKLLIRSALRVNARGLVVGTLTSFAVMAAVVVLLVVTSFNDMATHANALDDARSRETTRGALDTFRQQLGLTLNDYAAWDDAAINLYSRPNMFWVISNYGEMSKDSDLFDVAIVVDRTGNAVLSYKDGLPISMPVASYFDPSLQTLIERAENPAPGEAPEASGFVSTKAGIAAIGVALVRMKDGSIDVPPADYKYLIFARHLTAEKITNLSETYVVQGMALAGTDAAAANFVAISNADGEVLGKLVWTSRRPGDASYSQIWPRVLAAMSIVGVFFALLFSVGWIAIRKLRSAERRAWLMSLQDRLSGLWNRSGLFGKLDDLIEEASVTKSDVLLMYLDLDGFKGVNDSYGHGTGDKLIRGVAVGLRQLSPADAVIGRIGGDEFAIALCADDAAQTASDLGDIIQRFFAEPLLIDDHVAVVGCSIGYAISRAGVTARDELVRFADLAMYRAKEAGKGRTIAYDATMEEERQLQKELERDLQKAIEADELTVAYQPLVRARDSEVVGFEALARWNRKGHGPVRPDVFISVAETSGLIHALGRQIMRQAFTQAAKWPEKRISINISPAQFRDPGFVHTVAGMLTESGMDARLVSLEMTEGYLVHNTARARETIARLKALGVKIVLDDFGAGFSSIGYLRQFGFDRLKIDRTLITALDDGHRAKEMLQATVALARSLDIPVTAEGIEREDQAVMLRLFGCDEFQGYYFGRPVSAAEIDEALDASSGKPMEFSAEG
jgi:diguanylate cyclase (GGDEF)-like protein